MPEESPATEPAPEPAPVEPVSSLPEQCTPDEIDIPASLYCDKLFHERKQKITATDSATINALMLQCMQDAKAWAEEHHEKIEFAEKEGYRGQDILLCVEDLIRDAENLKNFPFIQPQKSNKHSTAGTGNTIHTPPPPEPLADGSPLFANGSIFDYEKGRVLAFWLRHQPKDEIYDLTVPECTTLARLIDAKGNLVGKLVYELHA